MVKILKNRPSYVAYEYVYSTEIMGNITIIAYVRKRDGENWLTLWCRTFDNMGMMHFMVGYKIEDDSEFTIRREVEKLAEGGYFDDFIDSAYEIEAKLQFLSTDDFDEE